MPSPEALAHYSVDEIREMRLQLLQYENAMLRQAAAAVRSELAAAQQKMAELEQSFELLSDMLVQCIKDLHSADAKTLVSQILAVIARVRKSSPKRGSAPPSPSPAAPVAGSPPASPGLSDLPPAPSKPAKPKIPQLSLAHVEPSAWLQGEPTAGDVYHS